jgi:Raf kinase inhibitor-like YbhB/YbcL family protein
MNITSTVFRQNAPIAPKYGYNGRNVNPPLTFSEVPKEAKSLVLVLEDPDAVGGLFTHWILYNIPPATLQIPEGKIPLSAQEAANDFNKQGYGGPKPPSGTHRYVFKLFALDTALDIVQTDKRPELDAAIEGHVIAQARLTGTFSA